MPRRFEHAGKNRFFEISGTTTEPVITSGAIEVERRRTTTQAELASFLREKLREGYVEVVARTEQPEVPHVEIPQDWIERIAEAFHDDEPRLVLADWLQTQGDPRGELIALQCERAGLDAWDPRYKPLEERETRLLRAFASRWLPGNISTDKVSFHRGFPERLGASVRRSYDPILEALPLIRALEVSPWNLEQVRAATRLGGITGLAVSGLGTAQLGELLENPQLAGVDRLAYDGWEANLGTIGRRRWRLLDLEVRLETGNPEGIAASAATVRSLNMRESAISHKLAARLAELAFPKLQRLNVVRCQLAGRSLGALARSPGLSALRQLAIGRNTLGRGMTALFESTALPALVWLEATETGLDDHCIHALARSPLAARLQYLDIDYNPKISANAAAVLAETGMSALRQLHATGVSPGVLEVFRTKLPHVEVVVRPRR